jgi:hypothetical protein
MKSVNESNRQAHESSPTTPQLTRSFCALVACFLLATHVTAGEPKPNRTADKAAFENAAASAAWAEVFSDSCSADWKEKWFLDGETDTVTNRPEGMTLPAASEFKNDAHHMFTRSARNANFRVSRPVPGGDAGAGPKIEQFRQNAVGRLSNSSPARRSRMSPVEYRQPHVI